MIATINNYKEISCDKFPQDITVVGFDKKETTVTVNNVKDLENLKERISKSYNESICALVGGYCGNQCSEFDCYH